MPVGPYLFEQDQCSGDMSPGGPRVHPALTCQHVCRAFNQHVCARPSRMRSFWTVAQTCLPLACRRAPAMRPKILHCAMPKVFGEADSGEPIAWREVCAIAPVTQPLLCKGKLMRASWWPQRKPRMCLEHDSGIRVPMSFKGNSLCVKAAIYRVGEQSVNQSFM